MELELEAPHQKIQSTPPPPPSSPLIFLRNREDDAKFAICSISDISDPNLNVKTSNKLRGKELDDYFYGWFVLKDEEKHQYSLWNPLTSEFISLPRLDLSPEQEVNFCVLTSPPHESNSKFVIFEKNGNSLFFCKIRDEQWTYLHIKEDYNDDRLDRTIICNGMIYGYLAKAGKLVQVDLNILNHPKIQVFDKPIPGNDERPFTNHGFLIESCNELYFICLYMEVRPELKVDAVQVSVLDFSNMEWKEVNSFEDKAFFITLDVSSFCCPAIGEIKGNHVYFNTLAEKDIYSINMDDQTISVFPSHVSSSNSIYQPTWIMTDSSANEEYMNNLEGGGKRRKLNNREIVKPLLTTEEDARRGRDFSKKLFSDVLFEIGKRLFLCDYISFRSANKECQIACAPIQWAKAKLLKVGFHDDDYNSIPPPWLTYWRKGDNICKCLDLLRNDLYLMNLSNEDVMTCHSRSGWCVMLHEEKSIFLWNPLTKETILLPNLAYNWKHITTCSLSSTVDLVFLLYTQIHGPTLQLIFLKEGEWHSQELNMPHFKGEVKIDSNMVYYDEHLYIYNLDGNLSIYKKVGGGGGAEAEWNFQLIHELASPCSFDECFLVECGGKIISVFVGLCGERIQTFVLDFINMVWAEIEDLGNKTLYISRFSSFFASPPIVGMENRIYFARYNEKNNNVVYYSLKSRKLHAHGTEEVLKNFYNTKEQLFSCWVEVNMS